MKNLSTLLAGALFGIGVTLSGMVNPMRVLNFFDLTGIWDPTLIFVMGGGLLTTLVGYHFIFKRKTPMFDDQFHLPLSKVIDAKLVGGAALFGIGWGIAGFCPGPAIASLVFGQAQSFIFLGAMIVAMLATKTIVGRSG